MIRFQVNCDECTAAWAYPRSDDDPVTWLRDHGWLVIDGLHTCPNCARRP